MTEDKHGYYKGFSRIIDGAKALLIAGAIALAILFHK